MSINLSQKTEWNGEGLPPTGIKVEVLYSNRWTSAITVGLFGNYKEYMVCAPNGKGFFAYESHEIRPVKSDKEKWIELAIKIASRSVAECDVTFSNAIYEALISGELPMPQVKK